MLFIDKKQDGYPDCFFLSSLGDFLQLNQEKHWKLLDAQLTY